MGNMMDDAIELVVGVLVGALLAAYLLPIAIDALVNTSTTGWGSDVVSLWDLLPLIIVLAIFLLFVAWAVSVYRDRS